MQNEPNLPKAQMNVNKVLTKDYENKPNWTLGENEPKTNPNKANFRGKIMLLSMKIQSRCKSLGHYPGQIEAPNAYDRLTKKYRREYPVLNSPAQSLSERRNPGKRGQTNLKASYRSLWGLRPRCFSGSPFLRLRGSDPVYGFFQPLRWIFVLLDSVDVGQRRLHQERLVSQRRALGIDFQKAGAEPFDNVRVLGGDVRCLVGICLNVVKEFSHELVVALADGRDADTATDFKDDFIAWTGLSAEEHTGHIETVDREFLLVAAPGDGDESREEIGDEHHPVVGSAGLGVPRPANDAGYAHATFERGVLCAAIRLVHLLGEAAVVVGEDKQGVLGKAVFFQCSGDAPDGVIEALQGGLARGVFVCVSWNAIDRSVNGIERDVEEKRLLFTLLGDNTLGFGGDKVGGIALFLDWLFIAVPVVHDKTRRCVVRDHPVIVVDAPGVMAVLVHETLLHRQVFLEPFARVPFPDDCSEVARFLEGFSDGPFVSLESVDTASGNALVVVGKSQAKLFEIAGFAEVFAAPVHPVAEGIAASQKGAAGRRADRVSVELREPETIRGKPVDMGGELGIAAVEAGFSPAHVVAENKDDVWSGTCEFFANLILCCIVVR